jgi:hypothetical protein
MSNAAKADSPFYDNKKSLVIYEDKIVLPDMDNREITFDDINYIIFRKVDFSLYRKKQKFYYITIFLNDNDLVNIDTPISGYYALKKFYEKGIKTNGEKELMATRVASLAALVAFITIVFYFVL